MYHLTKVFVLSAGVAVAWVRFAECFQPPTISQSIRGGAPCTCSRATAVTELRLSEEDRQRDLKFQEELEKDAELWIDGDPTKRELWEKAKNWRKVNQMILERQEAMAELENEKLRYLLKDLQTVTGLPLVEGKEITPLAWSITLTVQLMPVAALYIIFSSLAIDQDPQPVLDASRPFWA